MNSGAPYAAVVGAPFMGTTHGGHVHRNATTGLQELKKSNLIATTDPTVGDDTDDGYAVGSQWINVSSGSVFTCTNAAAGAANWTLLGGGSGVGIPAGSGTEVQYRVNATTFGAVTGSSWDGTTLTLPKTNFSGVVGAAAGSAAAPSLSFSGDTDTGFFLSAANKIGVASAGGEMFTISTTSGITPTIGSLYGFGSGSLSWLTGLFDRINAATAGNNKTVFNMSSAGTYYGAIMVDPAGVAAGAWSLGYSAATTNAYGTPVLTWTGDGRVGIGTATPIALAHINSSTVSSRIKLTNSTTGVTATDGFDLQMESSAAYVWNYENGPLYVGVNNATAITVTAAGRVGIGITGPGAALEVASDNITLSNMNLTDTRSMAITCGGQVYFWGKYTSGGAYAAFGQVSGSKESGTSGQTQGSLVFQVNTGGGATAVFEKMRLTSAGYLGIGKTAPAAALDVMLSAQISVPGLAFNEISSLVFQATRPASTAALNAGKIYGKYFGGGLDTSALIFQVIDAGGSGVDAMCITNGGNVGIGIASGLGNLLHVRGTANQTGLRVDSGASYTCSVVELYNANTGATAARNWRLASNYTANGMFEIQRSLAADAAATTTALAFDSNGNVGIGTTSPSTKLHVIQTAEQLRLGYDATKYTTFTVDVGGDLNVTPSGNFMVLNGKLVVTATGSNVAYISYQQPVDGQGGYILLRGGVAGTTVRGYVGFTHNGVGASTLFTGETADYVALRGENGVHLGVSTNLYATLASSAITVAEGINLAAGTTTGTKIGTATNQKLGFWNATPVIQQTTGASAATFVQNSGNAVNDASTFDGYTIAQMAKIIRTLGLAA